MVYTVYTVDMVYTVDTVDEGATMGKTGLRPETPLDCCTRVSRSIFKMWDWVTGWMGWIPLRL